MCRDFRERERQIGEPQTLSDLRQDGPRIVEAFEAAIVDKIQGLDAPPELADEADRLVDLADQQRDALRALVDAAERNDVAKVRELATRNAMLNAEASAITRGLGAEACAAG